jgi:RNA polymerase sigma factor (sigma-70 family)
MAKATGFFQYFRRLVAAPASDDSSDSSLLKRFVSKKDESAFAQLLQRHGPLVLRVCRQVLQRPEDADDAFQATFMVLARQAGSIRQGQSLPGWLYKVAYHIAVQVRGRAVNRQVHEELVAAMRQEKANEPSEGKDVWPILHDELNRLPSKYRTPMVLCYLDGLTNEEAAGQLNCPVGTVKTRLNRARDLLRNRLARRGVALTPVILAGLLLTPASASAAVPAALSQATLQAATLFAAGKAAAGASAGVSALAEAAVHGMFLSKVKAVASIFLAVGLVGGGAGLAWQHKHSADVSANTRIVHESAAVSTEEYPLEPTFPSTTVNYSKAPDVSVPGAAALSSRQGAELQRERLPSRQDQYNEFVAEEEQARRAAEAKKNAPPPPPPPKAEETKTNPPSPSWWDWLWLPW